MGDSTIFNSTTSILVRNFPNLKPSVGMNQRQYFKPHTSALLGVQDK